METKPELRQPSLTPVPADWTRQKDQEWYSQHFESDGADPYSEALKRLWHERVRLEEALTEWIGIFLAEEEFDPDPVTECLGASAKADLLHEINYLGGNFCGLVPVFTEILTESKRLLNPVTKSPPVTCCNERRYGYWNWGWWPKNSHAVRGS